MAGIEQGEGKGSQGEAFLEGEGCGEWEEVGDARECRCEGEGAGSEAEGGVAAPRPLYHWRPGIGSYRQSELCTTLELRHDLRL